METMIISNTAHKSVIKLNKSIISRLISQSSGVSPILHPGKNQSMARISKNGFKEDSH